MYNKRLCDNCTMDNQFKSISLRARELAQLFDYLRSVPYFDWSVMQIFNQSHGQLMNALKEIGIFVLFNMENCNIRLHYNRWHCFNSYKILQIHQWICLTFKEQNTKQSIALAKIPIELRAYMC